MSLIACDFAEFITIAAGSAVLFVDAPARKVFYDREVGANGLIALASILYEGLATILGEQAASGLEGGVAAQGRGSGGQGEGYEGKEIEVFEDVHVTWTIEFSTTIHDDILNLPGK